MYTFEGKSKLKRKKENAFFFEKRNYYSIYNPPLTPLESTT